MCGLCLGLGAAVCRWVNLAAVAAPSANEAAAAAPKRVSARNSTFVGARSLYISLLVVRAQPLGPFGTSEVHIMPECPTSSSAHCAAGSQHAFALQREATAFVRRVTYLRERSTFTGAQLERLASASCSQTLTGVSLLLLRGTALSLVKDLPNFSDTGPVVCVQREEVAVVRGEVTSLSFAGRGAPSTRNILLLVRAQRLPGLAGTRVDVGIIPLARSAEPRPDPLLRVGAGHRVGAGGELVHFAAAAAWLCSSQKLRDV